MVKKLVIVPGATHLFEEAGSLEQVAALARDWFIEYLPTTIGCAGYIVGVNPKGNEVGSLRVDMGNPR